MERLPIRSSGGDTRQENMDIRSMSPRVLAAFDGNSATVPFDELFGNEKPNACPNHRASGKERIEHPR